MRNETKTNVWERISKLWFMIGKMLLDGSRDPHMVADVLQTIVDTKIYLKRLFVGEEFQVITFGGFEVFAYELVKNSPSEKIFGELGQKRRRWKDNDEILAFSHQHKDKLGENGNFFEREDGFVVGVDLGVGGRPYVFHVYPLSLDDTWHAEYQLRVFCPQQ